MELTSAELQVKLTYFKKGGKYVTEGVFSQVFNDCRLLLDGSIQAYMPEICERVRVKNILGLLPGLDSGFFEEGHILVECEQGYPCLLEAPLLMTQEEKNARPDTLIQVEGKTFRCDCGCNVFKRHDKTAYSCNACEAIWREG